jgi:hypothetical protein
MELANTDIFTEITLVFAVYDMSPAARGKRGLLPTR